MRRASITSGSPTKSISKAPAYRRTPSSCCRRADTRSSRTATGVTASASPWTRKPATYWAPPTGAMAERRLATDAARNVELRLYQAAAASRPAGHHGARRRAGAGAVCLARSLQLSRKRARARAGQLVQVREDRVPLHALAHVHGRRFQLSPAEGEHRRSGQAPADRGHG